MSAGRIALAVLLVAATVLVGVRILDSGHPATPIPDPRQRLAVTPLDGGAFAELAKGERDPARRLALHKIAARRAPRDLEVRAWLVEHHLAAGDHAAAMTHLDVLLRLAPNEMLRQLVAAAVQLSADPAFADALVDVLVSEPTWRRALLIAMRGEVLAPGSFAVVRGLYARGALGEDEFGPWLQALIKGGAWGQAYALWVSSLDLAPGEAVPMLWNGDFEQDPDEVGFGWRINRAPGSYVELEEVPGARGRAARIEFRGRQVATGNLEQPLHLPPGRYRLAMRVRAQALRSDQGLRWQLACSTGDPRYHGEPIDSTFEWRQDTIEFDVPITNCPGQWLRLRNFAPRGSARMVSGTVWIDDVTLKGLDNPE